MPVAPTVSAAVTTNVKEPATVGVPLSTPALLKLNPVGKFALTVEKLNVPVPPVAAIEVV